ncbi:MAG: polysaccharide biosynthesis protein [Lachnospiraceae bacterium]|nr:polysaccharide biosynthesis protein [Lachnospiraceae bacterium]
MDFDLDTFIAEHVTERAESMFQRDLERFSGALSKGIRGKRALVIGGAGSIGSAFIKELLCFEPEELTVVDTNENGLTELTRDLRSGSDIPVPAAGKYRTYPMNYASPEFKKLFRAEKGFDIVANFSAHKHVRSEKDIFSVEALIRNNLLNARELLLLLEEYPPEVYFCVSTDKAANPVNIMGASKRVMEDMIFSFSDCFPVKTARFANVAFSNGSLPDGFLQRIAKKQPLTAPLDIKRYFVSPGEAGQICLLSCMLGGNREVFFPKLDASSMKGFDEMAKELLKTLGYEPLLCSSEEEAKKAGRFISAASRRYPLYLFSSDTSGEKPYEEFYTEDESVDWERFESLGVITEAAVRGIPERNRVFALLDNLEKCFLGDNASKEAVVSLLAAYLPEFHHLETGKNLDGKM